VILSFSMMFLAVLSEQERAWANSGRVNLPGSESLDLMLGL
jgi:hypothetical protein